MSEEELEIKILVDLRICLISCPGVRLNCLNSKVYVKMKMFECLAFSSKIKPKFPLIFFEHFYFEKEFECKNTSQLFDCLSEHYISIELFNDEHLVISRFESNVLEFLFPKPQLRPKYSQSCRSLLMDSYVLPIGPKLEFQVNSTIIEEKKPNIPFGQ